jgi:hypothetical protein
MAKTRGRAASEAEATPELSAKVQRAVDAIRKPFNEYNKAFAALSIRREELAPRFMKAANLWMAETSGNFVAFVRFLDPSIGSVRAEYRNHRTYQSADYLRRLAGRAEAGANRPRTAAERAAAPAPPTDAIARIVASLMTAIPEDRQAQVWAAMEQQLHWTTRQINRLQTQVEHVDPIVTIRGRVEGMRLTFPTAEATEERAAA